MKKTLNTILRDLREDNDIKQDTIAKYLGISQQTYSNYENGRREIPITAVKALAKFYKVSTDYLLRSDTSYLGSMDMNATYIDDVSMHDIIFDMQKLDEAGRKDLVKYIRFQSNYIRILYFSFFNTNMLYNLVFTLLCGIVFLQQIEVRYERNI